MFETNTFALIEFLLLRILKRSNQLHLFRRLEECSKKPIKCAGAIEFLRLCENLNLTPTFAKVDETKSSKWQYSSKVYSNNVLAEELRSKVKQVCMLTNEIDAIYAEIRETCSLLRYMLIERIMTTLRKNLYQEVMTGYTRKTLKLVYNMFDVEEHINNISSYQLLFLQKLVLCRGLNLAIPQAVSAMYVKASFEKAY